MIQIQDSGRKPLTTGAIVGIVFAVLFGLIILGVGAAFIWRYSKRAHMSQSTVVKYGNMVGLYTGFTTDIHLYFDDMCSLLPQYTRIT